MSSKLFSKIPPHVCRNIIAKCNALYYTIENPFHASWSRKTPRHNMVHLKTSILHGFLKIAWGWKRISFVLLPSEVFSGCFCQVLLPTVCNQFLLKQILFKEHAISQHLRKI